MVGRQRRHRLPDRDLIPDLISPLLQQLDVLLADHDHDRLLAEAAPIPIPLLANRIRGAQRVLLAPISFPDRNQRPPFPSGRY